MVYCRFCGVRLCWASLRLSPETPVYGMRSIALPIMGFYSIRSCG